KGTVTDDKGYYSLIVSDSVDEFKVRYSMIGYRQVIKEVKFGGQEYLISDVAMHMEPLKAQGIIVSAKKKKFRNTASMTPHSLSDKDLKIMPSFVVGDLMRTIEALPGVTKSSDFSTSVSVRGGSPDQNRVLLDDVPLLNPFHLFGLVSAFNSNSIKSAELYSSGIPVRHDASLSSVLDIKTKGVGRQIEGLSGVTSLSLLSGNLAVGSKIPSINSNFLLSVRRTYADKLLPLFGYELPYYFYDGYIHWETDIKDWSLVLSGYTGKDFLDIRDEDDESIKIIGFDWGNDVAALNLFHSNREGDLAHIFAGYSNHDFYLRVLDTLFITNGNIDVGTFGAAYTKGFKKHEITVGLEDYYRPFEYNVNFNMGFSYSYEDIWSNRLSMYIEDEFKLSDYLIFSGGLALTHYYSKSGEFDLENSDLFRAYRLSAKYFFDDLRALTFSFGNFHQYIVPGGNLLNMGVDIPIYYWIPLGGKYDPEEAHHFNLGFEGWLREDLYFSLESYYRKYSRLLNMKNMEDIHMTTEEEYYETMLEEGDGKAYGLDFLLKKEIGNLRGWLSYSFLKTDVTFGDQSYPTGWDRNHNFHLTLLALLGKKYEAGAQFSFCTGNPYTTDLARYRYREELMPYGENEISWVELQGGKNQVRYPSYVRLDLSLGRSFYFGNNELDIKLSMYNVLNSKNVFMYYYDYDEEPPVKEPFYMLPRIPALEFIYKF
ncbi:MAG: TonB-dependent receptor plug domain-containing protein, partial [candidate division WOR-3 bacterium]